ncbi:MAG: hypothetical protein QNK84_02690 [Flavobacteriales bacterium]
MKELSYDLVDHICCMIEEKMESGKNYASALDESIASFGKKGIRQIQEETTFLLTKNILAMRRTMHITGITSATLLLLGSFFKIQHWPGASLMYVLGAAGLCLLFMPLFLAVRIKEKPGKLSTISNVIGILGAIALCAGILFKIMHWPWASTLMNVGGGLLLFIFLPIYIYNGFKTNTLKTNTIVPLIVAVAGFSLMFSLVRLNSSQAVRSSMLNIQYNINKDIESCMSTNNTLASEISADKKMQEASILAKNINSISEELTLLIAKSKSPDISDEEIKKILITDYIQISETVADLNTIRNKDKGLVELISLVNNYTKIYQQVTGVPSNLSINQDNLDYYLKSERASFPLGIVIHDLSLLNLQVQRLHTGLLQYYKGKVS